MARAAHRREHRQARRDRAGRQRAARGRRGVRPGPGLRPHRARRRHRREPRRPGRRARGRRPSGDPDRHERSDRPRRGVRPMGGRNGDRRSGARDRPVRPAERGGGQGADATRIERVRHRRPGPPGTPLNWSGARDVEVEQGEGVPILADGEGLTLIGDAVMRLTADDGSVPGELAAIWRGAGRTRTSRSRRSSPRRRGATRHSPGSGVSCATARRAPRPRATGRGSCTRPAAQGRAATGWFIQLTSEHAVDRPIPDWPYIRPVDPCQAAGDFGAIETHDLPILRVHLGADIDAGLAALERALEEALSTPARTEHAHRVHRTRPDGGQHGSPSRPRRTRGRRLQPDPGETRRSPVRARPRRSRSRRWSTSSRSPARALDHGSGRRRIEAQIAELMEHGAG